MKTLLFALCMTVAVLGIDLQAQSRGPRPLWERFPSRIANPDTDTSLWMQKQCRALFLLTTPTARGFSQGQRGASTTKHIVVVH